MTHNQAIEVAQAVRSHVGIEVQATGVLMTRMVQSAPGEEAARIAASAVLLALLCATWRRGRLRLGDPCWVGALMGDLGFWVCIGCLVLIAAWVEGVSK